MKYLNNQTNHFVRMINMKIWDLDSKIVNSIIVMVNIIQMK